MDHLNNTKTNRQDLPLEFDSPARPDTTSAPVAPPPAPPAQSAMATETSMIRRPVPIIAAGRRPDALTTQNIGDDVRVRTVPASSLPGAGRNTEPKPAVPFGRYLAEQRKRLNLTLEQVDNATLIRKDYLEALELEALDKLPPSVYVIAYVRKLGRYYKIPAPKIEELIGELKRNLEYSVPEALLNQLEINTEPCEENTRTMHKIMWTLGIGIPALIVILVLIIVFTAGKSDSGASAIAPGERIPESRLEFLLEKPVLAVPELPKR